MARRNKLLGLWTADLMHIEGAEAESYAKEVVLSDFEEPGDEDVFRKVDKDLKDKGIEVSEEQIREKMQSLYVEAQKQILAS